MFIIGLILGLNAILTGIFGKKYLDLCFCIVIFVISYFVCTYASDSVTTSIIISALVSVIAFIIRKVFEVVVLYLAAYGLSFAITALNLGLESTADIAKVAGIAFVASLLIFFIFLKIKKYVLIFVTSYMGGKGIQLAVVLFLLDDNIQKALNQEAFFDKIQKLYNCFSSYEIITYIFSVIFIIIQFIRLRKNNEQEE